MTAPAPLVAVVRGEATEDEIAAVLVSLLAAGRRDLASTPETPRRRPRPAVPLALP